MNLINNSSSGTDVQTACDNFTWIDGVTYTAITILQLTLCRLLLVVTASVTLNLTINNSTAGTDVQDVCDNFTWIDGVTYTASNTSATYTIPSNATGPSQGCDSVVTLNLTIRNSTSSLLTVTECDSYTWGLNGQTYTTGNTYIETSTNSAGCPKNDSLVLTINPLPVVSAGGDQTVCSGLDATLTGSGASSYQLDRTRDCD